MSVIRTPAQWFFRSLYVMGVFTLPLFGVPLPFLAVAIGALAAYDGLAPHPARTLGSVLWLPLGVELLYGMDLGILSLASVSAALVCAGVARFVALAGWAGREGWALGDLVRSATIACGFAALLVFFSWMVGQLGYGYGQALPRLLLSYGVSTWTMIPFIAIGALLVLRRIDEPFRRPLWP